MLAGPVHPRGCRCPRCDRSVAAELEAARLRDVAATAAARKLQTAREAREADKAKRAAEGISREVARAEVAARRLLDAKRAAEDDPKAARLRELRAAGKTMAEAFEIIESEGS